MNTKKITHAAVLSAIFVILSILAVSTGVMYSLYLDIIVPIFICVAFLILGYKYMILMCITSLLLVTFTVGDVVSAIWMSQGMILGIVVSLFISRKSNILEDFFYASILGIFVMMFVDIYFAKLTGYSLINDSQEIINNAVNMMEKIYGVVPISNGVLQEYFYISISLLPMGTVLIVYISAILLGKKIRVLDDNSMNKYKLIKNYKKIGSFLCCGNKTYIGAIIYVTLVEIMRMLNIEITFNYLKIVVLCVEVLAFYMIIKDAYSFICKYILYKSKSKGIYILLSFIIFVSLFNYFRITVLIMVIVAALINIKYKMREKQLMSLDKVLKMEKI